MSGTCWRRTQAMTPRLRHLNGLPDGPLPHVYGTRKRTLIDGEWVEWTPYRCSWCSEYEP